MTEALALLLVPFLGGIVTGALNYLGLWQTTRMVTGAQRPLLLVLGSMAGRTAACMAIFYLLMDHRWERLLACAAGFSLVRLAACRRMGKFPLVTASPAGDRIKVKG